MLSPVSPPSKITQPEGSLGDSQHILFHWLCSQNVDTQDYIPHCKGLEASP